MSSSATFIKSAKITPTFPNDGKNYASTINILLGPNSYTTGH